MGRDRTSVSGGSALKSATFSSLSTGLSRVELIGLPMSQMTEMKKEKPSGEEAEIRLPVPTQSRHQADHRNSFPKGTNLSVYS